PCLYLLHSKHTHYPFSFFFTTPATTELYTLSLHDALPICPASRWYASGRAWSRDDAGARGRQDREPLPNGMCRPAAPCAHQLSTDRKSTRLNSSHSQISYAVFCLKKKKKTAVIGYIDLTNNPIAKLDDLDY